MTGKITQVRTAAACWSPVPPLLAAPAVLGTPGLRHHAGRDQEGASSSSASRATTRPGASSTAPASRTASTPISPSSSARISASHVEFVPLEVANRIPALTSGRVDVLFATMAMLPERAKAVQFSKPYVANIIMLIAPKNDRDQDQRRHGQATPSACRAAAAQDTQVTKNAPASTTIRRFDGDAASIQALVSGQVQARRRQHLLRPAPRPGASPASSRTSSNSSTSTTAPARGSARRRSTPRSTLSSTRSRQRRARRRSTRSG